MKSLHQLVQLVQTSTERKQTVLFEEITTVVQKCLIFFLPIVCTAVEAPRKER
jgi:hypothetical protein